MKTIQRVKRLPHDGNKARWVFRLVKEDRTDFMLIQQWTEVHDGMNCFINTFNMCDENGNLYSDNATFTPIPTRFGWIDEMMSRGYTVLADAC